jgi:uncharacterized protein YodC (DUF2158 family)
MRAEIKVGQAVRCLAGGPTLYVAEFDGQSGRADCLWYDSEARTFVEMSLPIGLLKKVSDFDDPPVPMARIFGS